MSKQHGRHTLAFLLLLLSESPSYGAMLLSKLQTEFPHCFSDSADVYRCLEDMTAKGLVRTSWETGKSGQPRKWYTVTPSGRQALKEQYRNIRMRMENLEFFTQRYRELNDK